MTASRRALALATIPALMLGSNALGALPAEECAIADVVLEIKWRDASQWHHLTRGLLHVRADGRTRRYRIQVFRHDFGFDIMELPAGGTAGSVPPSLMATLIPSYWAQHSGGYMRISANGEVHERTGDLELRVRREACARRAP